MTTATAPNQVERRQACRDWLMANDIALANGRCRFDDAYLRYARETDYELTVRWQVFRRIMMQMRCDGDLRSWRCSRPAVEATPLLPFRRWI